MPAYNETSLDAKLDVLQVGLAVTNSGSYTVGAPLLAVIRHLSDPSILVRGSDGLTSGGDPYFVLDAASPDGVLAPGQSTRARTLNFYDPNGIQFTYDLVMLGRLNQPPAFSSEPNTEAIPGLPYAYQATATDADHDPLTFALLAGPAGMSIDAASGKLTWNPQQSDLGNQTVLLQVDDGRGGKVQQQYTVSTIACRPIARRSLLPHQWLLATSTHRTPTRRPLRTRTAIR